MIIDQYIKPYLTPFEMNILLIVIIAIVLYFLVNLFFNWKQSRIHNTLKITNDKIDQTNNTLDNIREKVNKLESDFEEIRIKASKIK